MDALVYEDSPLAAYYEGQAVPADISGRTTPEPTTSFAPQGLPELREKIRSIGKSATQGHHQTSEQILEQFRYIIIASQLLSEDGPPRPVEHAIHAQDENLLRGAVVTATVSFLTAWSLHWLKSRRQTIQTLSWTQLAIYCLIASFIGVSVVLFTRWQYAKSIQKSAAASLTQLVNDSHAFDTAAGRTLRFVQEVELVARGYDIGSSLLSPISRLEDTRTARRCQRLRAELSDTLTVLITLYVEGHNALQPYVVQQDLRRYHDIYEVSLTEYAEAINVANDASVEGKMGLKELRFALRLHTVVRKVVLCDLLALRATRGWHKVKQWNNVQKLLRELEAETSARSHHLSASLHKEEFGKDIQNRGGPCTPLKSLDTLPHSQISSTLQLQNRRFDDIARSVRALNAKVHVLQDEMAALVAAHAEEAVLSATSSRHFESLGNDIRTLQYEYEKGRNSLLLHADTTHNTTMAVSPTLSNAPFTPSPRSPRFSGFTVVDGGPADALRLLNGDDHSSRSSDGTLYDEEVFEAVSKPKTRSSMGTPGMTREEKVAKMAEERRKRATLQEKADNTTNMLRELQMVIKHRPNAHMRSPSTPVGSRVSSI